MASPGRRRGSNGAMWVAMARAIRWCGMAAICLALLAGPPLSIPASAQSQATKTGTGAASGQMRMSRGAAILTNLSIGAALVAAVVVGAVVSAASDSDDKQEGGSAVTSTSTN